jgi:hypothetical protein
MHVVGLLLLFVACAVAAMSIVVGAPGTVLIVLFAAVYAWLTDFQAVTWATLGWLALLAVVGEVVELMSSAAGAAGRRPSRLVAISALVAAFVGGIIGLPFLFGVGALLGALAGAFAGAALASGYESRALSTALASGWAALRGRFFGFVVKAALAATMVGILAMSTLFT